MGLCSFFSTTVVSCRCLASQRAACEAPENLIEISRALPQKKQAPRALLPATRPGWKEFSYQTEADHALDHRRFVGIGLGDGGSHVVAGASAPVTALDRADAVVTMRGV